MMDIKVVAFDCDGVMFDTVKANKAYYNRILEQFGKPPLTPERFAFAQMHTAENSLAYLFDYDEKILNEVHAFRRKTGYIPYIKYMEPEPYLKPLIEKLRPAYKTAVATNRTDTMVHVLKEFDLESYFDLVVTALDVERPKPHPDQFYKIMDFFSVKPDQILYVGDSELDEKAAESAGVHLIAFNNPSLSADFHITSMKEIEPILLD